MSIHNEQLRLEHTENAFSTFTGTSNVSTENGSSGKDSARKHVSAHGWSIAGMVKDKVNGSDVWVPFFTYAA